MNSMLIGFREDIKVGDKSGTTRIYQNQSQAPLEVPNNIELLMLQSCSNIREV